jgi:hypothetical protein
VFGFVSLVYGYLTLRTMGSFYCRTPIMRDYIRQSDDIAEKRIALSTRTRAHLDKAQVHNSLYYII